MHRRHLLQSSVLAAGSALAPPWLRAAAPAPVQRVILVWKCHLDVGFTNTQAAVVRKYWDIYFPEAIDLAVRQRDAGEPYIWTTGSWLLYGYLEQASPADRRRMEESIGRGDIAWHALPFSWQTELCTASTVRGALAFSRVLDARFGQKTIAAKMTDVPGHTRGIVAPLEAGGIQMLDIGVNAASYPPDVPDVFRWHDSRGSAITVVYHRKDYGSTLRLPGTPVVFSMQVRGDNSGPHTPEEIHTVYAGLRAAYPGAEIVSGNLSEVVAALAPVIHQLPVVQQEIGDTWIHGVASDPEKLARFRHLQRTRDRAVESGAWQPGSDADRKFLTTFLLGAEHTWGTDTKSYLDNDHYRAADLQRALTENLPGYHTMERSWQEKRDDLATAAAGLPLPTAPDEPVAPAATPVSREGYTTLPLAEEIDTPRFRLRFDPSTGAIVRLGQKSGGTEWASPSHPLALFTYQTLSAQDFAVFLASYIQTTADWAPKDFGKPNVERFGAQSREFHPSLVQLQRQTGEGEDRIVAELRFASPMPEAVAWPASIALEITIPQGAGPIRLRLLTLGKAATRMPEAMWLTFAPVGTSTLGAWSVDKCGEPVRANDILRGGNRAMHAVESRVQRADGDRRFSLALVDSPVVCFGKRTPLPFTTDLPNAAAGVHVNLFNNAWGTNYPQWAGGDWSYRMTLDLA